MIIATAGHVDHGKTSLVKALTDIDTDRLAEEQRRGMTIDIGFAYADVGCTEPLGFVDVPGHERFVRNMLAGVACVDLALLVVAADDGPMPQTLEHLAILGLLGVPRCVVALTKIDRVSAQRLAQAGDEIAALLAEGPFAAAPIFPLVATDAASVRPLRQHLQQAAQAWPARSAAGHFRLAVDRSFTLAGAGRVVTGAVLSGRVRVGDVVTLSPAGGSARVRGIHAHNQPADEARAGQRCALNLAGAELKQIEPARGHWVLAPAAHAPTQRLDVQLQMLPGQSRSLRDSTGWQLHIGAASVGARVSLLQREPIAPGSSGLAQLLLDAPIAALRGDRFIMRDAAAQHTLAGGWVIDPFAPARGRARPERLAELAALAVPNPAQALQALLESKPQGLDLAPFCLAFNLDSAQADALQGELRFRSFTAGTTPWALQEAHWQAWHAHVLARLKQWHLDQPDSLGLAEPALAEALGLRRQPALLRAVLAEAAHQGAIRSEGLRWRLHDHVPQLAPRDAALLERIQRASAPGGLRPPIVGELATQLEMPLPDLMAFLARAGGLGLLVRVASNRYYFPATVQALAAVARELSSRHAEGFDAAAYRDASGIGRNLTIQVLEFLDREGITRFDGLRRRAIT